ncbi:two component transcriptional regulator, winged helix family [Colwellia psychrerythraea]|uniref:Two component transcriptional regulator, winged helix family n=2 Tax=Colwellia psychrerythraea TaxID=28229 RepID=A0A099KYP9_COLPS|nr:response regulator transcription factor [Colwellia psychrerythraea]KGJ94972.1 two component transcriptional regulator, winged helix family [Colwellia psychrerythraea]
MHNILLVEDDISLADWVCEYLTEQGFNVTHVARGDLVMHEIKKNAIDIVLLDVMLPGLNGIEVCRLIRQHEQSKQIPIIMLTARADEFDEVIGLEAGADDYVIKPVRPRALLARINRQLSHNGKAEQNQSTQLTFGELTINQEAKRVIYQGKEIDLSTSLFAFLTYLAQHAGSVVDRDSVFKALKKREYDGQDRRFDVMLSTLRKLFNDDPQKPQKFKTIWGKGYLFVGDAWQETSISGNED